MDLFLVVALACGILFWGLGRLGEWGFVTLKRRGTARVVWVEPDAGAVGVSFHKRKGNEIKVGKGDEAKTFILEGKARQNGDYPTWMIHWRHGWNLTAPTDEETVRKDDRLRMLAISNPESYDYAIKHNDARD